MFEGLYWRIQKLNSLTTPEYIILKSSLIVLHTKEGMGERREFNCSHCLSKFDRHQHSDRMVQANRDRKGCFGHSDIVRYSIDDLRFGTCPANAFNPYVLHLMELNQRYRQGVMPFEGPLTSQPAKILEAFGVIESYNQKLRKEQEELAKSKQGSGLNGRRKGRT